MVAEAAASGHGISASFQLNLGTPPLRNDDALTSLALELAADLGFESNEMPPMMGGDDFALYLDHVPGVYAFVGAGTPGTGGPFPHHHPAFQLEEGALDVACSLLSHLMLRAQDHLLARRSPLSRGPSERSAHP
jgi:amidohydrolase